MFFLAGKGKAGLPGIVVWKCRVVHEVRKRFRSKWGHQGGLREAAEWIQVTWISALMPVGNTCRQYASQIIAYC